MAVHRARAFDSSNDKTDEDLVAQVQNGDTEAFAVLIRRYNQRLYRVVRGIAGDDASAEDALQQTYMSAFRHLSQLRRGARFASWLRRIAVREALRGRRERDRMQPLHEAAASAQILPFPGISEGQLSAREWARFVEAAIDELPETYRAVLVMRRLEHLTTGETAKLLGLSEWNVRIRLHRARKLLKNRLHGKVGEAVDEVYEFGGVRCARITERVMRALSV